MRKLTNGARGRDVTQLQAAINRRAKARGLLTIDVDGEYGPQTESAAKSVAYVLGALDHTIAKPGTSIGEQRLIRWPSTRTPKQLARARARAKAAKRARRGPQAALREARKWIGRTESPPNSNRAPWGLSQWIKDILGIDHGVPWCGVACGTWLKRAGVEGITSRVAAVRFIHDDARAGRNGFEKLVPLSEARPGDLVGLFGLSTHVGMVEKRVPGGIQTVEGNTSPGNSGSQANGGGCYRRVRPNGAVVYVARPRWP